ncbi:MAG: TonB-dependent receptor [Opitutales bacterium]|nr:TonB-dependent receptor [Opitutales bacterium]NRA25629.1 TonB-dependent receptor [Opitutales bacterium]
MRPNTLTAVWVCGAMLCSAHTRLLAQSPNQQNDPKPASNSEVVSEEEAVEATTPEDTTQSGGANDSPRERGRVLLKRNPIASEYQVFGELGRGPGADGDGEGVDYRRFFARSYLLDSPTRSGSAGVTLNFNDQSSEFEVGGRFSYKLPLFDDSWMLSISASSSASDRIFEHMQNSWTELIERNPDGTPVLDENDNTVPQLFEGDEVFYLDRLRISRDLIYTRVNNYRARLEHAWSENHRSYVEATISDYFDNFYRNRSEVRYNSRNALPGQGDLPQGSTTVIEGDYTGVSIRRYNGDTDTERFTQRYSFGGDIEMDTWLLSYSLYTSEFENNPFRYDWNFLDTGLSGGYRIENPLFPEFFFNDGFDITDVSNAGLGSLRVFDTVTTDTDYAGRIDFETDLPIDIDDAYLRTGLIYREKSRTQRETRDVYGPNPDNPFTLLDVAKDALPGQIVEATYTLGRGLDQFRSKEFFANNPDAFVFNETASRLQAASQEYDAFESVTGVYALANLSSGPWQVEAGIRAEYTETETTGTVVQANNISQQSNSNDYWNYLPTIESSYQLDSDTLILASWYQVLMRPQYFDIVPYERISDPTRSVSRGNPDLEPATINNLQIAIERENTLGGTLAFEIYLKTVENFFYDASSTEQRLLNGERITYNNSLPANGEDGEIYGFQVQYETDLSFLREILDNRSFSIAYTLSESNATVGTRPGEEITVPERSRHNLATSLSLGHGPVSVKFDVTYLSKSLDDVGDNAGRDSYRDENFALNIGGRYQFLDDWTLALNFFNVTDAPERSYRGLPIRGSNNQYGSWSANLGLSTTF